MQNLSDANLFMHQLSQIDKYLRQLREAENLVSVTSLNESRICECLVYLIDLCLIVSKYDLNLAEVKNVGQ